MKSITCVIVANKRHAKVIKNALEQESLLDKDYRLSKIDAATFSNFKPVGNHINVLPDHILSESSGFISVPIHEDSIEQVLKLDNIMGFIVGYAKQSCSFSSSVLGDAKRQVAVSSNNSLNLVQNILIQSILKHQEESNMKCIKDTVIGQISKLPKTCTPPKLELMGDDRTLVIPLRALNPDLDNDFNYFLRVVIEDHAKQDFMAKLWRKLAESHRSQRVVRRGEIDPSSEVRESGHSILWMDPDTKLSADHGPGSRGWITITEQGIKQSFDLTKVMFSRGNISEKIRFGKLVKAEERVLDMYAGIGYYSLPALIHGKASRLIACEWNPHAASFLRYNLEQNGVSDRAVVLEGDSRVRLVEENCIDLGFDRVSLGLLPSSEGGWRTALLALRKDRGGWLHIHANVPCHERDEWALWMCRQLSNMYREIYPNISSEVCVICHRIEKVKSFAPKVDHFVADVLVSLLLPEEFCKRSGACVGILNKEGVFVESGIDIAPPSCALGNGVLDQKWMM